MILRDFRVTRGLLGNFIVGIRCLVYICVENIECIGCLVGPGNRANAHMTVGASGAC